MSHPMNHLRDHKVQHARVKDITAACGGGGMASGGHADAAQDKAMIHKMVKKSAMRAAGGAVKARADRPARAWGGRTGMKKGGKRGKSGHTTNVIIHPSAPASLPGHLPMVPGVAGGAPPPAVPPPMPPRPPMGAAPPPPGPMGGPPGVPGMPPGVPPPMMPRKKGGRVFSGTPEKEAFTIKQRDADADKGNDEDSQTAGIGKEQTPIRRDYPSNKQDTPNIGRKAVITKATGGPISSQAHGQMGPEFSGGGGGGTARKEKAARLKRAGYGNGVSIKNPTQNPKPGTGRG